MLETYTLRDEHQPYDHGGEPVAPLSSDGTPFAYAWRQPDNHRTIYATNADALLAEIIPGYDPHDPTDHDRRDGITRRLADRARHAQGVVINHASQAIMSGADQDIVDVLQRSTDYTRPLTHAELPEWTHEIPLLLIGAFYGPDEEQHDPPTGNVIMLRVERPESYLDDLHDAGVIILWKHARVSVGGLTVSVALNPEPSASLAPRLEQVDQALAALKADASEFNEGLLRERVDALLRSLDAAPLPGVDSARLRSQIASAERAAIGRLVERELSKPVHAQIDQEDES